MVWLLQCTSSFCQVLGALIAFQDASVVRSMRCLCVYLKELCPFGGSSFFESCAFGSKPFPAPFDSRAVSGDFRFILETNEKTVCHPYVCARIIFTE